MRDLTALPYNSMEHMVVACWQAQTPVAEALEAPLGPPEIGVAAHVNHGRWLVECPTCCGAQFALQEHPRFMCNYCANVAVEGLWRPVTWPTDRAKIEAALDARVLDDNKNWSPGDSVKELLADNVLHGVA